MGGVVAGEKVDGTHDISVIPIAVLGKTVQYLVNTVAPLSCAQKVEFHRPEFVRRAQDLVKRRHLKQSGDACRCPSS